MKLLLPDSEKNSNRMISELIRQISLSIKATLFFVVKKYFSTIRYFLINCINSVTTTNHIVILRFISHEYAENNLPNNSLKIGKLSTLNISHNRDIRMKTMQAYIAFNRLLFL